MLSRSVASSVDVLKNRWVLEIGTVKFVYAPASHPSLALTGGPPFRFWTAETVHRLAPDYFKRWVFKLSVFRIDNQNSLDTQKFHLFKKITERQKTSEINKCSPYWVNAFIIQAVLLFLCIFGSFWFGQHKPLNHSSHNSNCLSLTTTETSWT